MLNLIAGSLGAFAMGLSGLVAIAAMFALGARAFKVAWYWGLITYCVPGGFLLFSFMHWPAAKKPLLISITALAVAISTFILRSVIATFLQPVV